MDSLMVWVVIGMIVGPILLFLKTPRKVQDTFMKHPVKTELIVSATLYALHPGFWGAALAALALAAIGIFYWIFKPVVWIRNGLFGYYDYSRLEYRVREIEFLGRKYTRRRKEPVWVPGIFGREP